MANFADGVVQRIAAERIVGVVIADLCDRRGFRQVWDDLDDETRDEITERWTVLVTGVIGSIVDAGP